jgi:hypothetical protein
VGLVVPIGVVALAGLLGATGTVGALGISACTLLPAVAHGTEVGVVPVAEEQVVDAHLADRHGGHRTEPDSGMCVRCSRQEPIWSTREPTSAISHASEILPSRRWQITA